MEVSINKRAKNIQFKNDIKAKMKDDNVIVLFRCGDFYEAYDEDAEACEKHLNTSVRYEDGMRMIAFPNRALDIYLPRLVARGFRIAIADEMK
jgi:DNA mismatch repair protein MutS